MPRKGELSPLRDKAEALLKAANYTVEKLMEKMEVCESCARWHMRRMKEAKLIYVVDYERRIGKGLGGSYTKVYAWGNEPDAPAPVRDQKANNERHRAKRVTLEKARRRAKMDPTNPFLVNLCSTHLNSLRAQSVEKTTSQFSPTSAFETVSSKVSMASFAWPRPLPSALTASPKRHRS